LDGGGRIEQMFPEKKVFVIGKQQSVKQTRYSSKSKTPVHASGKGTADWFSDTIEDRFLFRTRKVDSS
jgi:hypothetical protein